MPGQREVPGEVPVEQGEDGRFRCPKCDFTSTYRKSITRHLLSKNTHPEGAEAVAVPAELDPMDLDNTMEEETSAEALRPKEELVDKVQKSSTTLQVLPSHQWCRAWVAAPHLQGSIRSASQCGWQCESATV